MGKNKIQNLILSKYPKNLIIILGNSKYISPNKTIKLALANIFSAFNFILKI
jgi:hypothetical protein